MDLFVPGRICLFGEHSDWAGGYRRINSDIERGYAIITGTNQGLHARIKPHPGKLVLTSTMPDGRRLGPYEIPMTADAPRDPHAPGGPARSRPRSPTVSPALGCRRTTGGPTRRTSRGTSGMSRKLRALALVLLVAACGGEREHSAPRNLDNACRLLDERPTYLRAFRAAEQRWGVPVPVQMAIIYQESKFIGNARTPHQYALGIIPTGRQSSAYGYSQALDGTWEEYQRAQGRGRRDDIRDATDFMGWYMDKTTRLLGIPKTDARSPTTRGGAATPGRATARRAG